MANRLIKKYPNRRLYDTRTSTYITLADVKQLVLAHEGFQVVDAKSGDDLTRSILLQIILEEEAGGAPMFSSEALAQMIRFYGHAMQGMMGKVLETNIRTLVDMQDSMRDQARKLYGESATSPADVWTKLMNGQGAGVQNLMSSFLDQSRTMAQQMQERVQQQTRAMFGNLYAGKDADDHGKSR